MDQVGNSIDGRQLGSVLLTEPISRPMFTMFFVAITIGIAYFFATVETTRKVHCVGQVVSSTGVINVSTPQAGLVLDRRVGEGQWVEAGQALFVMSGERTSNKLGPSIQTVSRLLQERVNGLHDELGLLEQQMRGKESALSQRSDGLRDESDRLNDQVSLQTQHVNLSRLALLRFEELSAGSFISVAQLQVKRGEWIDQCQRLADLQRMRISVLREISDIAAEIRNLRIQFQRDRKALQRTMAAFRHELADNEARREWLVLAAQSGVVTSITAELGQTINAAQIMALIVPHPATFQAEIFVSSRSVGFLRGGMEVLLRYHAYPFQKFGQFRATVGTVAEAPHDVGTRKAGATDDVVYRIRLNLERQSVSVLGQQLPLKPGMQLDASIVHEKRRLYEWILEPLFSISGGAA